MLEEGLKREKEAEREMIKRKSKTPEVPVISVDPPHMEEVEEVIAQLKEQVKDL